MRAGFSLIELLVATFIAALMCGFLFTAFFQSNRTLSLVDNYVDVYSRAEIVGMQFERDWAGVCVPLEYYERLPKKEETAAKEKRETPAVTKNSLAETPEAKKEIKPLEKMFYSTNQQDNLALLTFITSNPLQVYWSEKSGAAKPRMVRVAYRLKEEKQKGNQAKKSYQLVRQESSTLEFSVLEKADIREYVIANGIKSAAIEFISWPELKPNSKEDEKKKREIKKAHEWDTDKKSETKEEKEKPPLIPQLMRLDMVFWDEKKKKIMPFSYTLYRRTTLREPVQPVNPSTMLEKVKNISTQVLSPLAMNTPVKQPMQVRR